MTFKKFNKENFNSQYINNDDYLFQSEIDKKNLDLFRFILIVLFVGFIVITYLVVDKVFFNKVNPAPKLLLVIYLLSLTLFYFLYHEFSVKLTNIIIQNKYPI
tara:strand:+ start:247 stop:555 length:309 start_codon:yes stop_codon:yes gene_type:complete